MHRSLGPIAVLVAAVLVVGVAAGAAGSRPARWPTSTAKQRCRYVVKKVHRKKKRVLVCRRIKPKPTPTGPPGSQAVRFPARDGLSLAGRLWGAGTVPAVILVHGNDPDLAQGEWWHFAPVLVRKGYRVLTFDLGGFCPGAGFGCSKGPRATPDTWLDVAGAVDYLRSNGVQEVFLLGGSLGGHTVLWAAAQPGIDVAGVISVSAPQNALGGPELHYDLTADVLRQITEPKLFMAGQFDSQEGYSPPADAQSMYDVADKPKQLALVPSSRHASALLPSSAEATNVVLDFLAAHR